MFFVQHEHLVRDLECPNAMFILEHADIIDHALRIAHPIPSRLKRRVDAAKTACIRTAERRIDAGVWLMLAQIVKTLPIVRLVLAHRQLVPDVAVELREVFNQRSWIEAYHLALIMRASHETRHGITKLPVF